MGKLHTQREREGERERERGREREREREIGTRNVTSREPRALVVLPAGSGNGI
jgi:hypothetical protein